MLLPHDSIFKGVVHTHTIGTTKTGSAYLGIHVQLTHQLDEKKRLTSDPDPFVELPEDLGEVHREVKLWLTKNAASMTKKGLNLLGYDYKDNGGRFDLLPLHSSHEKPHDFKGTECFVRCTHQEWNGESKENLMLMAYDGPKTEEEQLEALNSVLEGFADAIEESEEEFELPDYDGEEFEEDDD